MALVDANGLPISLSLNAANHHESSLTYDLVRGCWTDELPKRTIGDKAFDNDNLDKALAEIGVEMIAAHRKGRTKPNTQDGRKLRRKKRRWKVERFFSWLHNYRRLVVRYEYKAANFFGFVLIAAIIMHVKQQV